MSRAGRWRQARATCLGVAVMVATSLLARRAGAHAVGVSTGEYTATSAGLAVSLVFARVEIAALLPGLDANRDGHVTALELELARSELEGEVLARIRVRAAGAPCAPTLRGVALTEQDGVTLEGRFDCPVPSASLDVDVALLDALLPGHRHVARALGASTHDEVLTSEHATFAVARGAAAKPAAPTAPPEEVRSRAASAWAFFTMGIEHILTGYDHLVFLFGLVLLRSRARDLVAVITAFTVAHSLTLAVAVLGVFTPRPRLVEPAIALSILYVGVENFFVKDARRRWRITFPFGLLHGFGFAGALSSAAISGAEIKVALVSFNVGVEAGQLLAMALLLPMVALARQRDGFEPRGVRVLSGAVALAGGAWFVLRLVKGG